MRDATEVFSEWAGKGKDEGMERGHAASVNEMLNLAFATNNLSKKPFSAIDIGCGNGWVVRKLQEMDNCQFAQGVDGSISMIEKARTIGVLNHDIDYLRTIITTSHPFADHLETHEEATVVCACHICSDLFKSVYHVNPYFAGKHSSDKPV